MYQTLRAPQMSRTSSNLSQRSTPAMSDWQMSREATNDYALYSDASTRQQQYLQSIPEAAAYSTNNATEYSVDAYLSNFNEPASSSSLPPSLPMHSQQLTPNWGSYSECSSPSTPSTALMTPSITQYGNLMSRQSSCGSYLLEDSPMLRMQSDSSCMFPIPSQDGDTLFPSHVSKSIDNSVDGLSFPTSLIGSSLEEPFFSPVQSASVSVQAPISFENATPCLGEDMWRSASTTSSEGNVSDASLPNSSCSRQKQREESILLASTRKIAPKANDTDNIKSAPLNVSMARTVSQDSTSNTLCAISKTPYVRPQHPKIMCQFCPHRTEGFRGTHELDRHIARAHAQTRKGYICVDSSPDKKFLANCKHCRNKKVYGAYYNAAAHLRRAHFHPRKRGRKGKNDEKRGGIGGGDDPPMDLLKMHWIKELEVDNKASGSSPSSASDDATEVSDNNAYDSAFDVDAYTTPQPMSVTMNTQQVDQSQFDFSLSMNASETIMCEANSFATYDYNNVGAPNGVVDSSFQFEGAYM
jgi:hypothetical protein